MFIFLSGVLNLRLISSSWSAWLPLSFPVSSFYYPKAKVHNVSDGSFDWDSEGKVLASAREKRGGSAGRRLNYLLWRCAGAFHETEAIINMQWHMHTSKMILDASSWIIKFPKVPFAHRILRAATASLMNHSCSARIYGKGAGGTGKRENGPCVLLDCPDENYISFEQFDSIARRLRSSVHGWQEGQWTDCVVCTPCKKVKWVM